MKKGGVILLVGLLLAVAAFVGFYRLGTAKSRAMMREPQPELAWLKWEFHLSESDFARIAALHEAYLPRCAERCRLIEEQNARLKELLAKDAPDTAEIQQLLAARASTRAQCEMEMLKHFQQVSRAMPADQGRRYLAWIYGQTVLRPQAMEARHHAAQNHHHPGEAAP